jgi:hypothetical protein
MGHPQGVPWETFGRLMGACPANPASVARFVSRAFAAPVGRACAAAFSSLCESAPSSHWASLAGRGERRHISGMVDKRPKGKHNPSQRSTQRWENEGGAIKGVRTKRPRDPAQLKTQGKAADLAGDVIDRHADRSATSEERESRKRRLLKGPKEFRDMRRDQPKTKR